MTIRLYRKIDDGFATFLLCAEVLIIGVHSCHRNVFDGDTGRGKRLIVVKQFSFKIEFDILGSPHGSFTNRIRGIDKR